MTDETRRAQRKNIKDHSPPRKYTASPDMDRTIILVGVIFDDPSIDVLECRQLITAAKREGVVVVFRTKQGPTIVAARNPNRP